MAGPVGKGGVLNNIKLSTVATAPGQTQADKDAAAALQALVDAQNAKAGAAANAATSGANGATAKAQAAGKSQAMLENQRTDDVVASLLKSLDNFASGRDTSIKNAQANMDTSLSGILKQYLSAAKDSDDYALRNEQDYDSKANANTGNLVRESNEVLQQALSQGAGETDVLKTLGQATRAYDANANDVASAFNDTLRSINSQLASASNSAENGRLNAWQQNQDAQSSAWNDYYKNMADTWTNIQRAEAGNTNVDSDYSVAYNPKYSAQAVNEIPNYVGKVKEVESAPDDWAKNWDGKRQLIKSIARLGNQAAAVQAGPLRAAEGATLRKW